MTKDRTETEATGNAAGDEGFVHNPHPPRNVKCFNFKRKPIKPTPLMYVARFFISYPDLKKRGAKISRVGMDDLDGKPYLLLITHSSMVDFNLMLKATDPYPINNVMSLEGFNTYTLPLMYLLGVLGKRKFVRDMHLIRNIRYCTEKLKSTFVLFPETRYSLDGCTSYLPDSLGGLVHMLRLPVAVLRIHGNFVTCPQWNKINKGTYVEAELRCIVNREEASALGRDEINRRIHESFEYDDFRWQYENKIAIDHPERARGLHALLYKCPRCGAEFKTDSAGNELWCNECGARWEMDVYGRLSASDGGETVYSHIPDWTRWERECVRREVRDGTYRAEYDARIETLPGWTKFYKHGHGKFVQTPEGTTITVDSYYGGEPIRVFRGALDLESIHIEYDYLGRGDAADVSFPDESFWCYLDGRDAITKISFATEEINALAREKKDAETAAARASRGTKSATGTTADVGAAAKA